MSDCQLIEGDCQSREPLPELLSPEEHSKILTFLSKTEVLEEILKATNAKGKLIWTEMKRPKQWKRVTAEELTSFVKDVLSKYQRLCSLSLAKLELISSRYVGIENAFAFECWRSEFTKEDKNLFEKFSRIWNAVNPAQQELKRLRYDGLAMGMAWGYFINLAERAFPQLKLRIKTEKDAQGVSIEKDLVKLLILVPSSCSYSDDKNGSVEFARPIKSDPKDIAGTVNREYHQCLYKLNDLKYGKNRPYFVPEMASCLITLNAMGDEAERTKFTPCLKDAVRDQFVRILGTLLREEKEFLNAYQLISYQDAVSGGLTLEKIVEGLCTKNYISACDEPYFDWSYTNLGVGLANWFYFNYLSRQVFGVLLRLMENWETEQNATIYKKLIILVPRSCCVPDTLIDDDENIERATSLEDHVVDEGTTKGRTYTKNVYRLQGHDLHFVVEFATPIRQLYKMRKVHPNRNVQEDVTLKAREEFVEELNRLLDQKQEHRDICEVVQYIEGEETVLSILRSRVEARDEAVEHKMNK